MSDVADVPEPRQPIELTCTRCWRAKPLRLLPKSVTAAETTFCDWHPTKDGWVCPHCWTGLDHIHERELCRLCGRDARANEDKRDDWEGPDLAGDFVCPECRVAGEESVRVQIVTDAVGRWRRTGRFLTGYQG